MKGNNDTNKIQLQEPKYDALTIAKYLLFLDKDREYFTTGKMTNKTTLTTIIKGNFRLNQVLYLLQIFYFLEHNQFLFKDKLYAWENGVIVYSVYTHFWSLYNNINDEGIKDIENKETEQFIKGCFKHLKSIPDRILQEFSYNDPARFSTWSKSLQPDIHFTNKENLEFYQQFRSRWLQEARL
ncbi:MAG: hypothetical protein MRECE_11c006 [Mycoplasmataceae bacterium CE_OT135]|nr:MAG: hypothetical protein MRECE_31c006 [Mycoplasmataceae bacterium CE_OT135]KLL03655.1 MAG: hypothetical protein MRECE_11c006 [Mycoplasmataceae bacterium CE_OT135]